MKERLEKMSLTTLDGGIQRSKVFSKVKFTITLPIQNNTQMC